MDPLAQGAGGPRHPWLESRWPNSQGAPPPGKLTPLLSPGQGPISPKRPRLPRANSTTSVFLTPTIVSCPALRPQNHTLPHSNLERRCATFLCPSPTPVLTDKFNSFGTFSPDLVPIPWPLVPTRAKRDRNPSGVNHCGEKEK